MLLGARTCHPYPCVRLLILHSLHGNSDQYSALLSNLPVIGKSIVSAIWRSSRGSVRGENVGDAKLVCMSNVKRLSFMLSVEIENMYSQRVCVERAVEDTRTAKNLIFRATIQCSYGEISDHSPPNH